MKNAHFDSLGSFSEGDKLAENHYDLMTGIDTKCWKII